MGLFGSNHPKVDLKSWPSYLYHLKIVLPPGEILLADAASLMYMDIGIDVSDISNFDSGLIMSQFTNNNLVKANINLFPPKIGRVEEISLDLYDGCIICRQEAFLAALKGVSITVARSCSPGINASDKDEFKLLFLQGEGAVFLCMSGMNESINLAPGEQVQVDSARLAAMTGQVACEFSIVSGIKSAFWSGEGWLRATLTGPGQVWLQSDPCSI